MKTNLVKVVFSLLITIALIHCGGEDKPTPNQSESPSITEESEADSDVAQPNQDNASNESEQTEDWVETLDEPCPQYEEQGDCYDESLETGPRK